MSEQAGKNSLLILSIFLGIFTHAFAFQPYLWAGMFLPIFFGWVFFDQIMQGLDWIEDWRAS